MEGTSLNGLGTERLADGPRYEGQWRDGVPAGLGVRDKPGIERAEGNFVVGRLEGLGMRRTLAEPNCHPIRRIRVPTCWMVRASRRSATASATKATFAPASAMATAR